MNCYRRSSIVLTNSSKQSTASIVEIEPFALLINGSMLYLMGLPTSVALFALVGTCPPPPVFSSLGLTSTQHKGLPCSSRDKEYDGDRQGDPERAFEQASNLRREITDLERDLASLKMSGKSMSISTSMGQDKTEALQQTASASRSSSASSSPFKLAPTRWLIHMDIGREKGTWMPPTWGASGRRVEIDVSIQFLPGGEMTAKMASPFIDMIIKPGEWSVRPSAGSFRRMNLEGNLDVMSDTCQFWVECSGFKRGDVTIPPGKIFFGVPVWGGKLFRRGLLTIRQRRLFIREEARILGVFETEVLEVDADGREQERASRPRKPPFPSGYK